MHVSCQAACAELMAIQSTAYIALLRGSAQIYVGQPFTAHTVMSARSTPHVFACRTWHEQTCLCARTHPVSSFNCVCVTATLTCPNVRQTELADVLQLVVDTCPNSNTPTTLCSLLCVSSACRAAVQRAAGHCHVNGRQWHITHAALYRRFGRLGVLENFLAWLPAHRGLVSSLHVPHFHGDSVRQHAAALLTLALQQCAAAEAAAAACGKCWCLRQFSGSAELAGAAVLQALPAAGLQEMHLDKMTCTLLTAELWSALGQLSSLTSLTLEMLPGPKDENLTFEMLPRPKDKNSDDNSSKLLVEGGMPAAVGRLQLLAKLHIGVLPVVVAGHLCQQLPTSLQALDMFVEDGRVELQLGHLVSLVNLCMNNMSGRRTVVSSQSVFPPHLTRLEVGTLIMEEVPLLAALKHLSTQRDYARLLVPSVLSRLESLSLHTHGLTWQDKEQHVAALAHSCTLLTSLCWKVDSVHNPAFDHWQSSMCSAIAQLRQLRSLELLVCEVDGVHDFTRLTALSMLTALKVSGYRGKRLDFHNEAASALACSLTALQTLWLVDCCITDAVLPVVAKLTGLQDLNLCSKNVEYCGADLNNFTGLTQLTRLSLMVQPAWRCSAAALAQLQAQLPGLRKIKLREY